MIKAGDVVGRTVTVREGGQMVGKVKDLVVDGSGGRVLGFLIGQGAFKRTKVAPYGELQALGPDSLVLSTEQSITKAADAIDIKAALAEDTKIRGLKLQTTDGKHLGTVEDFYFDEASGQVEGYEISGGVFSDAFGGRSFMPTHPSLELGEHVAFVDPEAEMTIRQPEGGLKGVFKKS